MSEYQQPLLTYNYRVEIEGLLVAGFSEVSGLEQELEVEEYKESGVDFIHKFPNGIKYTNIVLKRGMTDSTTLRDWFTKVLDSVTYGKAIPKEASVYISLMNSLGEEKVRYHLKSVYPIKWTGPQLNANANEVAIEILELVHEGFVVS